MTEKNKHSNAKIIAAGTIAIIFILGIVFFGMQSTQNTQVTNTLSTSNLTTIAKVNSSSANAAQLFSSSSYYNFAHLIAQNPTNNSINYAAVGATLVSSNSVNNTLSINVTELLDKNSKTVILTKGQSLYYYDFSYADDSPPNGEHSLFDDLLITVNSSGFIVNQTAV